MRWKRVILALCLVTFHRGGHESIAQDLVIAELMAVNDSTIQDEDGDFSDWFEIFNAGSSTVDIGGYYATDDKLELTKWQFPPKDLEPGSFLLVFASDKDRRNGGSELHANFKLSSLGEYLALIAPDGVTPVWEYDPYPVQVGDFSYGLSQNGRLLRLVPSNASARTLIPSNGALGLAWTEVGFDDSAWIGGTTGVGYDRNTDYRPLFGTDVRSQMENRNTSAYIRISFTVSDPAVGALVLRMKYDDGFIAYINGVRVASSNGVSSPQWDSAASGQNDDAAAVIFEEFAIANAGGILRAGENVLAIHGLNRDLGSSDFLILPELDGYDSGTLDRDVREYFPQPSPGGGNLQGFPGVSGRPRFSVTGTIFTGTLSVTLTTNAPDSVIRYTTDGSEPTSSSALFAAPISLASSTMVRARSFEPGLSPSPIVSEGFIRLAADVQDFNSNLPVVIVDNFGGGSIPANSFQPAFLAIFDREAGRSRLTSAPDLETRVGIKIRGSSTLNRPKKAYGFEAWDEKNEDKDIAPLGMPAESDWILYGAYNFDRALLRNPFIYELSNQVGRYAVRTKFCEVFVNTGGGSLSLADYVGVYSFMEKIKRGPDRVDVEKLTASYDREPMVTGGYMMKIDRRDPGDSGFRAGGQDLNYVYPKEDLIAPAQANWLRGYIDAFDSALDGPNFRDPELGYARYIDVESWVDHHILNEFTKNPDGLRLSTFLFKKRGGKIEMGPIWDFDRTMGPDDDARAADPEGWSGVFSYSWWDRLFDDLEFWQTWIDRWTEFRRGPMSVGNMHFIVDSMALTISEAQARNFEKWPLLGAGGWAGEVNHLKQWLASRAAWIDSQFATAPTFSSRSRRISPGFSLTMTVPAGTIYYTLDGSDPRLAGGSVAPGARVYSEAVTLNDSTRVVARARVAGDWSGPTVAAFYVRIPGLVITEVMYHPPDPLGGGLHSDDDFEFIELMNTENEPLDISGSRIVAGIDFVFPEVILDPGEFIVVVKNREAFESRYGTDGILIAGEYSGNLENSGETVGLSGPFDEPILVFTYSDLWHPLTDGEGMSLMVVDPFEPPATWQRAESWTESTVILGTPGTDDPGRPSLGGRQRPGDSNQDGALDISDAISFLRRLYVGGSGLPCEGTTVGDGGNLILLDMNGDGNANLSDVVYILVHLFKDGPAPTLGTSCVRIQGCPRACGF